MWVFHLPYALSGVYVPDGHGAASVTRYNEAVSPLEFYDGILMRVEKSLGTLLSIEVPDEQTCVVRCGDTYVLIIDKNLGNRGIMANEVLASYGFRVPETE